MALWAVDLPSVEVPVSCYYSLAHCNTMLPLVKAVAAELIDRRRERQRIARLREDLEGSRTPEGLVAALADLDSALLTVDEAIRVSRRELEAMGLTVLRLNPVTVHFPGRTRSGDIVFCWQEGECSVSYGHPWGEEEDPRRPLRVRARD